MAPRCVDNGMGKMRAATLQLVDGSGCVVESERRAALTTNGPHDPRPVFLHVPKADRKGQGAVLLEPQLASPKQRRRGHGTGGLTNEAPEEWPTRTPDQTDAHPMTERLIGPALDFEGIIFTGTSHLDVIERIYRVAICIEDGRRMVKLADIGFVTEHRPFRRPGGSEAHRAGGGTTPALAYWGQAPFRVSRWGCDAATGW